MKRSKGGRKMAHMMKHTKASCGHMFAHFDRKAEHISNENLDRTKTHLNYNLALHQQMDQGEFVKQRCSEIHCLNRKDINVMCSWIVTVPKDLPAEEHGRFFKSTNNFLQERYGKENTVSAYVHMDEVTPHMHFAFVPVVYDEKKKRHKLSAKEKVNRQDLKTFHKDLSEYVSKSLGHEVSLLNEATKEGNRSIEELKRQSATERLQEATEEASKIVSEAFQHVKSTKDRLIPLQAEYEAKKAYVSEVDKISDVSMMYPSEAKVVEKGLIHKKKFVTVPAEMWEAKHISANEKIYLKEATKKLEKSMQEFRNTATSQSINTLTKQVNDLKDRNANLRKDNQNLRQQLFKAEREAEMTMEKVNEVLNKIPKEVSEQFVKAWRTQEKLSRNKEMDMDMGMSR